MRTRLIFINLVILNKVKNLNAIIFMPTDSSSLSGMTEKNKSFKTNIPMNNSKKITWKQILHAIIQAAIAALTALGVTSCTTLF